MSGNSSNLNSSPIPNCLSPTEWTDFKVQTVGQDTSSVNQFLVDTMKTANLTSALENQYTTLTWNALNTSSSGAILRMGNGTFTATGKLNFLTLGIYSTANLSLQCLPPDMPNIQFSYNIQYYII